IEDVSEHQYFPPSSQGLRRTGQRVQGVIVMTEEPTAAQKLIGDFAPKLIALNRPDQLRFHLKRAVENGLEQRELIEIITHMAFYAGWPNAMSAIMIA